MKKQAEVSATVEVKTKTGTVTIDLSGNAAVFRDESNVLKDRHNYFFVRNHLTQALHDLVESFDASYGQYGG